MEYRSVLDEFLEIHKYILERIPILEEYQAEEKKNEMKLWLRPIVGATFGATITAICAICIKSFL